MNDTERLAEAIERFDEANRQDPRTELVDGEPRPRELLFSQRVCDWVKRLADQPSDELLLAARGHTLRRWEIPRDRYPKTNLGYHEWRDALARFHSEQAAAILTEVGYAEETIGKVRDLITKAHFPEDSDARALEDADCLVFLETKLSAYLDEWDDDKTVRVLRGTLRKMTPQALAHVDRMQPESRVRELLDRARA